MHTPILHAIRRDKARAGATPVKALMVAALAVAALLLTSLASLMPSSPRTAALAAPLRIYQSALAGANASTSADWSGYATTGATYTSVAGSWTQPSVTCAAGETSYSAFWVGLDGDTTRTVEQVGTESDCDSGTPVYAAWYEMYPAAPVPIDRPVSPGDTLSASVTANGSESFTLTINDTTQGWTFTTDATARRAELGSAEWIAEAPSNGRRPLPLANFGSVTFSQCTANSSPVGANANLDEISMASRGGTVQAQPSDLSADGTSFSIAWASTGGAAPGSTGSGTPPTQPYPGHHHHWHNGSGGGSGGWGGWGQGSSAVVIDL